MKTRLALTLALVAGTTAAMAAPRDTVTLTNVPSVSHQGNAGNFTTTLVVADAYNATHINFTGTLGNFRGASWAREASVRVTAPSGNSFVVQASTIGAATAGTYSNFAIPTTPEAATGTWTFEFFDNFEDASTVPTGTDSSFGAYDSIWSSVTLTLDDGPAPAAPAVGSGPAVTFTNVPSDGLFSAPSQTRTWSNSTPFSAALPGLRVRGLVTALTGQAATGQDTDTPTSHAGILVTPPATSGVAPFTVFPPVGSNSTATINFGAALTGLTDATGDWTFAFFESNTLTTSGTAGDEAGIDNNWNSISFELVDRAPTGVVSLTADSTGTWASANGNIASAGGLQWFTFTAPATLTATGFLDIDTTGTNLSPVNDTDIAMYLANGNLVDSDEDDAANLLSQLSYGTGNRQRIGNGSNFSGQDGTIAAASTTGINPGGVYFVAVAGGNAATHASVFNTAGGANTGPVTLRVRAIDSGATIEAPSATVINVTNDGVWNSASASINNAGEIAWFTFTTPADLVASGAVDIDFTGTSLTALNDTDAGVYTATGTLVDSDDDDGTDLLSQLSYGATGVRRNPTGNGAAFRGQDGTVAGGTGNLAAATQYYIGVGGGTATTHGSVFNPSAAGVNTGSVTARVRAWSSNAPSEPAAPPVGAETLAFPASGATTTDTETIGTSSSKWYVLTVPVDIALLSNRALQIDNEGSTTSPTVNDTGLALYNSNGTLRLSDTSDGTDSIASLSFGADNRTAPGNGVAYNGRDGNLPAGTYYLNATVGGFPTFGADFEVTALSTTQSGTAVTNVRFFDPSIDVSGVVPPSTFTDAGRLGRLVGETESTFTFSSVTADLNTVQWFKFVIGADANDTTGFWLDIDTEGTNPSANVIGAVEDSEIGLYNNIGFGLANDDDDGSGWRSSLSFGQTTPVRAAINSAPQTGAVARNGRDGALTTGTYWLAVSTNATTHNSTNFNVVPPTTRSTTNTAARVVNFRTNLPGACGASDIAGAGQVLGADGQLTADDIIVFIGWFFAADARADIAGAGQSVGADGQFTADDIILFINRFFAGC